MLEEHRLERTEERRVEDRFPRFVGRNKAAKPQGYGSGIQLRVLTSDRGAKNWGVSVVPEERLQPLMGRKVSDLDYSNRTMVEGDVVVPDLPGFAIPLAGVG